MPSPEMTPSDLMSRPQGDINLGMCPEKCVWRQLYDGFAEHPAELTREECIGVQAEVRETRIKGLALHNCGIAALAVKSAALDGTL